MDSTTYSAPTASPLEVSGVAFCSHTDALAIYDELALFEVEINFALELTVHRVVLEHVCEVVDRGRGR